LNSYSQKRGYAEMKKLFRLPFVLSAIWFVLAFSSFYILDYRNTQNIANSFYSLCIEKQRAYPDDVLLEEYCEKDRGKILNEWAETRLITPFAFAFISLGIFWVISFAFLKTSKWAQSGE
jgi:hypothetical protein